MTGDLISRDAVWDVMQRLWGTSGELLDALMALPSAEKTGRWIWQTEDIYRCSECHEDLHVKEVMNEPQYEWCPMCGAHMKGVSE